MIPDWMITIITGLFSGSAVAGYMQYKAKKEERVTTSADKLRTEMWDDLITQRDRIDKLESDITTWKRDYFKLLEENIRHKSSIIDLLHEVKALEALLLENGIEVRKSMFRVTERLLREMEIENEGDNS